MTSSNGSPPTLGQVAFEAYGNHPGKHGAWTTFDGRPMPKWGDLKIGDSESGSLTATRWEVAVAAAIAEHERRKAEAAPDGVGRVDGPVFNLGRSEGRADVAAMLRQVVDPEDKLHLSLDGALNLVAQLVNGDRVDPFLMGIREIASATRDLAEAAHTIPFEAQSGPVGNLINGVATALHARVKALALPDSSAAD